MISNKTLLIKPAKNLSFLSCMRAEFFSADSRKAADEKPRNSTEKRFQELISSDKEQLRWRPEIGKTSDGWSSKFKLFDNTELTSDFLVFMQQPVDLRPSAIKKWAASRIEETERKSQAFVAERHSILGDNLATAHFLLYRGGSVRFLDDPRWHKANEHQEFDLPTKFDPNYKIDAIRCDNMKLYYEGLENIRNLYNLKFISFRNVRTFGDWCLDRFSGSQCHNIEVLDISGTEITARGLACLYRLPNLKLLIVDDPQTSLEFELSCSMLQMLYNSLKIVPATAVHKKMESEKAEKSGK